MKEKAKHLIMLIAGIVCVIVGVAGIFLPIIPGVPIMLVGLHLIGVRLPFLDKWIQRFKVWLESKQKPAATTKPDSRAIQE